MPPLVLNHEGRKEKHIKKRERERVFNIVGDYLKMPQQAYLPRLNLKSSIHWFRGKWDKQELKVMHTLVFNKLACINSWRLFTPTDYFFPICNHVSHKRNHSYPFLDHAFWLRPLLSYSFHLDHTLVWDNSHFKQAHLSSYSLILLLVAWEQSSLLRLFYKLSVRIYAHWIFYLLTRFFFLFLLPYGVPSILKWAIIF